MNEFWADKWQDWLMFRFALWPIDVFKRGLMRVLMMPVAFVWFWLSAPVWVPTCFLLLVICEARDVYDGH